MLEDGDKLLCQTQIKAFLVFKEKKAEDDSIAPKILLVKSEKGYENKLVNNLVKN